MQTTQSVADLESALDVAWNAREIATGALVELAELEDTGPAKTWQGAYERVVSALDALDEATSKLAETEAQLAASIAGDTSRDVEGERRRDVLRRTCEGAHLLDRAGALRTVRARIDALAQRLKVAERDAVRARIDVISAQVVGYYEQLNPGEDVKPTRLGIASGERSEVRVFGESYGVELNPVTTFSDGHSYCLALALALPYRVNLNPDWDVLVVDDPLFGLDPTHSSRLAELLASMAKETGKQLIVTTYYVQLARDLEHLLDAQRWEAAPYSVDGVRLCPQGDEIETLVRTAEVLKGGEAAARRDAGRKLREAFELLADRIGKPHGGKGQMSKKWRIDERVDRLEQAGVDGELIRRLRMVGDRVNRASHAEENDPTPEELAWCCEKVRELVDSVRDLSTSGQNVPA